MWRRTGRPRWLPGPAGPGCPIRCAIPAWRGAGRRPVTARLRGGGGGAGGDGEAASGGGAAGAEGRTDGAEGRAAGAEGRTDGAEGRAAGADGGAAGALPLELHVTSWVFPRGHRIRLAVSNAMWPMIWPTPSPATAELLLGPAGTRLVLPRSPGRRAGAAGAAVPGARAGGAPGWGPALGRDPAAALDRAPRRVGHGRHVL